MKTSLTSGLVLVLGCSAWAQESSSGPYDGTTFRGRILISADGNYNDEDDWGAFPVAIAVLDAMGLRGRLVHAHFNNILSRNDPRFEQEMRTSALGAQQRYALPRSIFHDCRVAAELTNAINSIRDEINRSTAVDPLYMVLTGPMDVIYEGIVRSSSDRRKYVYCISHNNWNDGYGGGSIATHNKRDVIPTGITWVQIRDGNPLLAFPGGAGASSTAAQWALIDWMKNSTQANLRWIHGRIVAEGRVDISDATVAYFLLTGDEASDLPKVQNLLDRRIRPGPIAVRSVVRMEAENFATLQDYSTVFGDTRASQRLKVVGTAGAVGRIRTEFKEPYTALEGTYDAEVRYFDASGGRSTFQLRVNGQNAGSAWSAVADSGTWRSRTVSGVVLRQGDGVEVEGRADGTERAELDYIGLTFRGGLGGAQAVASFTLVDADTDQDLSPLGNGAVLDFAVLPDTLNVRANTSPATVGSVRFALDGNPNYRTETSAPYALAGDTAGDYWPWTPSAGAHSLTATPWTGAGATGAAGTSKSVTFTVVGQPSPKSGLAAEGDGDSEGGCGATGAEALLLLLLLLARRATSP